MKVYLVGGAVRDELLNLQVTEKDWLVIGATQEMMLNLGYTQVGKDFPVFLHPETKEEYALARTEKKIGKGYHGFNFDASKNISVEEDLKRRDLTINAIAKDEDGNIIDLYKGQEDIQNKVLRHVSEAFIEDPLRVLRVARFAAKLPEFTVAKETMQLLKIVSASSELKHISAERIFAELIKALQQPKPRRFFEVLLECGALDIIMPEIANLNGVPQVAKWHPEIDTFKHLMLCLDIVSKLKVDSETAFSVLMHDLGKGITDKKLLPKHHGHEGAGVPLVKGFCKRLKVPTTYKELAILVTKYHRHIASVDELTPHKIVQILIYTDAHRKEERFIKILDACECDCRGRLGSENEVFLQREKWLKYLEASKAVDVAEIIAAGFTGEAISQAIYQKRVSLVKAAQSIDL